MHCFNHFKKWRGTDDNKGKKNLLNYVLGKKHLNLILVVLIIFFSIIYLLQMNHMSVKGYKIKDLENRMEELREDNQKLHLKVNEMQSLSYIDEKLSSRNFITSGSTKYVSATASAVAVK